MSYRESGELFRLLDELDDLDDRLFELGEPEGAEVASRTVLRLALRRKRGAVAAELNVLISDKLDEEHHNA